MKMKKYSFLIVSTMLLSLKVMAQDPQFSQFYAAPLLINPSFTGNMDYDCKSLSSNLKGTFLSRLQWGNIRTDAMTAEYFNRKKQLGLGMLLLSHRIGNSRFMSNEIAFMGSYKLELNEDWRFNSGLQVGLGNRTVGFNNLKFTDQFSEDGYNGNPTKDNINNKPSIIYPDIAAGGTFFNRTKWLGVAMHHLNRPNVSNLDNVHRLPTRISIHGGVKFNLNKSKAYSSVGQEISIKPAFQIKMLGPFTQMDMGCYYTFEPFIAGIWYRGIPVGKESADNKAVQDAAVLLIGYKVEGLKVGYSYDLGLSPVGQTNGGSHEISFSYQYIKSGCKKRRSGKYMPAPSF